MHEKAYFALQVKRLSSLPTVRNQRHRNVAQECKVGDPRIWLGINFSQQRNWMRNNKSAALRTKQRNITNGLGYQDSWGGVNSTYVHLRSIRAVHLNFKKSCGLTEQSVNVASSVPTITVGPSLNLTKQRPVACPLGPNEFQQNGK